jgi:hypothetical protein
MRGRRQRSVASILGRTKLTPQQADQLMAGSAAVRYVNVCLVATSIVVKLTCAAG